VLAYLSTNYALHIKRYRNTPLREYTLTLPPSTMDTQPHYNEDALPEFTPMKWSLGEIRAAIPPHLFHRNTLKGVSYVIRDFALAASFWWAATYIDPTFKGAAAKEYLGEHCAEVCRWAVWCV
jgi:hypothetical protein